MAIHPEKPSSPREVRRGLAYALGAYFLWGVLPVYWKALVDVPPMVILCHRIVWSSALLLPLVVLGRREPLLRALRSPKLLAVLSLTGAAVGCNWLIYIWSVNSGRILETSLGYFILPLLNVSVGLLFFKDRVSPLKGAALGLAALGVLFELVRYGSLPLAALGLAVSFTLYGLAKKLCPLDPLTGLFLETAILSFPALLYLSGIPNLGLRGGVGGVMLMVGSGLVTSLPLWLFAMGASRINLVTMGLVQYLSPSMSFLIGVLMYHEKVSFGRAVSFGAIVAAVALYTLDSLRSAWPYVPREEEVDA
ncbi:rarD protein [Thermanaerovibrio velox DSM 12556]|uniref:RarD protein n=1 Tax=Thermanaerovibrio velox DSM 12556 TaxID=926567 RepID=H0UQC4_9BACT|nr:EamA family transporter RarD [Thermanaerovibrio velox]EHM10762.1 rarD protein [Thermanaerovibrio velox DSM 12556]